MITLEDRRNELYQWDTGRKLKVSADCTQVHYSNKIFGRSVDVDVVDGIAIIPDQLLQSDNDLMVWAFVGTAESGYTKISKKIKVKARNKPSEYTFTPIDQITMQELSDRINALEESGSNGLSIPNGAKVGQMIVVSDVDEKDQPTEWEAVDMPEQAQADWNQNDKTAPDFVKNRPCYMKNMKSRTVGLGEVTFEDWVDYAGFFFEDTVVDPGAVVTGMTVTFDGIQHALTFEPTEYPRVGNIGIYDGEYDENGEPFAITGIPGEGIEIVLPIEQAETAHTVKIELSTAEIVGLPECYIPYMQYVANEVCAPKYIWFHRPEDGKILNNRVVLSDDGIVYLELKSNLNYAPYYTTVNDVFIKLPENVGEITTKKGNYATDMDFGSRNTSASILKFGGLKTIGTHFAKADGYYACTGLFSDLDNKVYNVVFEQTGDSTDDGGQMTPGTWSITRIL